MRDLVVASIIFGSIPFILRRPWIGIMMWCWVSYMNPHRISWGFMRTMPVALIIGLATLFGMLFSKEAKRIPWTRESKTLLVFVLWMIFTTFFALAPDNAYDMLDKVLKIQFMTFLTMILINTEQRLKAVIWMICLSLGFYGVKGGIFTIAHGGVYRVQGPEGTFIGGNNELALALIITIPLMRFLQLAHKEKWIRMGLGGAMLLSAIAAIGSHSRGAFLAIAAMSAFLWLKSRKKIMTGLLIAAGLAAVLVIMPSEYYERLNTIDNYQEDGSAMGRINAWWFAWNLAKDRPIVGGGFDVFQPWLFGLYAPNPDKYHDVHSIYFQVLGEHGFVGLALFLALGVMMWRTATRLRREASGQLETQWIADLAPMIQVSLVGYAVGGAFLRLAYFDLPYSLLASLVICEAVLRKTLDRRASSDPAHGSIPVVTRSGPGQPETQVSPSTTLDNGSPSTPYNHVLR